MSEIEGEILGVLRLNEPVLHNSASILGLEPLRIQTPPESWAYALAIPVNRKNLSAVSRDQRLAIEIDLEVEEGEIGVGALTADLQKFISTELALTPGSGRSTVRVDIDDLERFSWLMIRSGPVRQRSAILRVYSVRGYSLEKRRAADLWEVEPPEMGQFKSGRNGSPLILSQPPEPESAVVDLHRYLSMVRASPDSWTNGLRALDVLTLPDEELKALWLTRHDEATTDAGFKNRGWSHLLYREFLRGKKILVVGAGFGLDGIPFARSGSRVVFLDIIAEKLEIIRRLCRIFQLEDVGFQYLETVESLDGLAIDFDVVWCRGSLSHAPFQYVRAECDALLGRLPVGGRWIELAYPKAKWERDGCLPFGRWSQKTGRAGELWTEWYDLKKWSHRMRPAEFDAVLQFSSEEDDFCWFDMIRTK